MPRRTYLVDTAIAALCAGVTTTMQVYGIDSIAANRRPDAWSVLFTIAAVAPLALRRRAPLAVLAACFPGFLALIAMRYSVGAAPIGVLIAFYTVAVWDSRRHARAAVAAVVAGYGAALLLRPIDLSVEGTVAQAAVLVGAWVIGGGNRSRRELHEARVTEAERDLERERERAAHAITAERLRIARELHDVLGHAFSVMVVQAGVVERLIDARPDEARAALAAIGGTGRSSMAEMRRLLGVLRDGDAPDAAPRDPAPTLADVPDLAARIAAAGLPVDLRVDGEPAGLTPGLELAGYRVVQEALTNCLKHSGASRARVHLAYTPGSMTIEVSDDGRGTPAPAARGGSGLAGLRERVALYGGEFQAGAGPTGYLVRATLPVGAA